jgi:hypothetical protein
MQTRRHHLAIPNRGAERTGQTFTHDLVDDERTG